MDVQSLRTTLQGTVTLPDDAGYDDARQLFYGDIDTKPAAIVRVADAHDVSQAVRFAREHGLELAVRSGGHSAAGLSSTEGGIVLDLRGLRAIEVDAAAKTMWADAGLTAGDVTNELDKHGLVMGFGDTGSVGIGGITLGGGIGFLARKFGLAIDNLLSAEIVTADGEILQVDEENHPDLFWAVRGGGGNFGVATKFRYRLHELGECYGGMLLLPATPEVVAGFVQIASRAPDELTAIANLMPTFPMPSVPEEFHGKLSLMVQLVYAGDPAEAEKAVAPIRALANPIADMLKTMRYKDIFAPEDLSQHPTAVSHNMFVNDINQETAALALNWLDKVDAPIKALQIRVHGGAITRVASDATAFAHRQNPIMCNIACFYETAAEKQGRQQWVDDFAAALNQGDNAAYVNFLSGAEQDRLLDAYPQATLDRLRTIKSQYDPENFFHRNVNITPAP